MIETAVKKSLGGFTLDAALCDGGFICLAGRNGSGKSSFLKAISGQLEIDGGFVKIDGRDVTRSPRGKRGMVMVTPDSFIPHLDVEKHLRWGAGLRKMRPDDARVSRVKGDLGIDFRGKAEKLSLGMRERLTLATSLLASPRVILVDEAFSNLHDRDAFISAYRKLTHEAGIDVVFSTQDESDASLADHLYVISEGRTQKRK